MKYYVGTRQRRAPADPEETHSRALAVVMIIQLPRENEQLIIGTSHLASGVYTYKQIQNKTLINSGKLIIE